MGINKIVITGRVVRDAQGMETKNGLAYFLKFPLAIDVYKKTLDGFKIESKIIDLDYFGNDAKQLEDELLEDTLVGIVGRLLPDTFKDKEGREHTSLKVRIQELYILDDYPVPGASQIENDAESGEELSAEEFGLD